MKEYIEYDPALLTYDTKSRDTATKLLKAWRGIDVTWENTTGTEVIDGHFDWRGDRYDIELKARECSSSTYDDTILSTNKVDKVNEDIANGIAKGGYFMATYSDNVARVWEINTTDKTLQENFKGQKSVNRRNETKLDDVYHYKHNKEKRAVKWTTVK